MTSPGLEVPNYRIRRAGAADADALTRLRVDFLQEAKPMSDDVRETVRAANGEFFRAHLTSDDFAAWVAEIGPDIVATGLITYFTRPPRAGSLHGRDAFLSGMYTVPKWRRLGIGSAMLAHILAEVKRTEARTILLNALPDGRGLYERVGFRPSADHMSLSW